MSLTLAVLALSPLFTGLSTDATPLRPNHVAVISRGWRGQPLRLQIDMSPLVPCSRPDRAKGFGGPENRCWYVTRLAVSAGGRAFAVPRLAFADLGNCNDAAVSTSATRFALHFHCAESAEDYGATLRFTPRHLIRRTIDWPDGSNQTVRFGHTRGRA